MLTIHIIGSKEDVWDQEREIFVRAPSGVLKLEHSLLSISKWESKYHKPFLVKDDENPKTGEEILHYIKCMTLNDVDPDIYNGLTVPQIEEIGRYISDTMTATTIADNRPGAKSRRNSETLTSELIYFWMVEYGIPFECQKWHLNRLLMLINICNIKKQPDKKMGKRDIMAQNRALNAARRAKHHSRG